MSDAFNSARGSFIFFTKSFEGLNDLIVKLWNIIEELDDKDVYLKESDTILCTKFINKELLNKILANNNY
jgi:hypothetical protein